MSGLFYFAVIDRKLSSVDDNFFCNLGGFDNHFYLCYKILNSKYSEFNSLDLPMNPKTVFFGKGHFYLNFGVCLRKFNIIKEKTKMNNVIDFETQKNKTADHGGLNFGLKFISMPSRLKDNLAKSYQDLAIKLQTIIDLLSDGKQLSTQDRTILENLKNEVKTMEDTDKHYRSILEAAKKAGYYSD